MPVAYRESLTPLLFLERTTTVFPDKIAVVYKDRQYTYREFHSRVHRLAGALKQAGIRKGDRVAWLTPNTPSILEAHFGVPLAGGVLVAINTRLSSGEIEYILQHSESKILVADVELQGSVASIVQNCPDLQRVVTDTALPGVEKVIPGPEYEEFLESAPAEVHAIPVEDEMDLISINYTSGTTGRPKGVMYHHRGAYLNAAMECLEVGLTKDSIYLWTLPAFHCNGWCFPWANVAVGATQVCLRKVDPAEASQLIVEEGVTHLCGAPTVLSSLASYLEKHGQKMPHKVHIVTAAAPPTPAIIRAMEALGAEITHVYGLTEVYGPFTVCEWRREWDQLPVGERARLKARQGVPYIGLGDAAVWDGNGRPVPRDGLTMGEVVLRGNGVMLGYFKSEEATDEAFAGGWFHSGDLGVWHPDGYIELRDRKKDIIISGGENISTIEVERCISEHPAVLEVAVVGIPHDHWGEVPKAFISLRPGFVVLEEEILNFCRERIARFKVPRQVTFGELPKTSTGKVQKYILREREWRGMDRRI
jgi:fatty-acyl-CoA synthase